MFQQYLIKDWRSNLFIVGVVLILMVIFLPIPTYLLDFLQIVNFSVALLILLLTFCTDKPLSFSTFPSIILIATLFRLALNISATRLILSDGDAGEVIAAIGEFVVAGNYVIGFIIFIIFVVVQYVVVTNGAQRVAEVAARFTLDSMPGKQMAIDADMNMGLIDEHEARERRANIEREANFYGAMDGATKFVKGDAIAGIVIILINIIGGVSVGVGQNDMSWGDALAMYSLLTIGDGIVTQIPSLIIAVATGIIITRAATDYELSHEIGRQVSSHPRTLILVTFALTVALFFEALPTMPILLTTLLFAAGVWWAAKSKGAMEVQDADSDDKEDLVDYIKVHPIEIRLGEQVKKAVESGNWDLERRLEALKKLIAKDYGYIMPDTRFKADSELTEEGYEIHIHGSRFGKGEIRRGKVLVISDEKVLSELKGEYAKEPAYGLPALWIEEEIQSIAQSRSCTVVEPEMVLFTHISEVIKNNLHDVISRKDVEQIIQRVRQDNASLVEEIIPSALSVSDVHRLLRLLMNEKVTIRHIEIILEAASEHANAEEKNVEKLVERVRERLASRLCDRYLDNDEQLNVITMTPQLESMLKRAIGSDVHDGQVAPGEVESMLQQLVNQCEALIAKGYEPVLLCSASIRAPMRKITERIVPRLAVISAQEVKGVKGIKTVSKLSYRESL